MRRFFILLTLAIAIIATGHAQSLYGKYTSKLADEGTCHFIHGVKLKKLDNIKGFQYDMACQSWTDSTTINMSIFSLFDDTPKEVSLSIGGHEYLCSALEIFYIEKNKKNTHCRISVTMPNDVVHEFMKSETPPIFNFKIGDTRATATYSASSWKKDSKKLRRILEMINLSRKR
ncbi:MAG: hypothetical protein J6R79_01850 [Bacteroidaceae bacterium]|nr:hypothetical protein [Bacteroidaceae bacterium]